MKKRHTRHFKMILMVILMASSGLFAVPEVSIHYMGHASFLLQFDNGVSVLTDYGTSNCWGYASPIYSIGDFIPTILTYSHRHEDHYNEDRKPEGVQYQLENMDSLDIDGLSIRPVRVCESAVGSESSTAFIFTYKGIKVCHLSDAQADIMAIGNESQQNDILARFPDQFDLLLMTIEGVQQFIPEAEIFVNLLKPRRIIPMHYWTSIYKKMFLDHLEKLNSNPNRNYEIVTASADYSLSTDNPDITPVLAISLSPKTFVESTIDESEKLQIPVTNELNRNYPNPFNPTTTIKYALSKESKVTLTIFNATGQIVEQLVDQKQSAGYYSAIWDASNVTSGLYFYRMQAGDFSKVNKCMLLK